MTELVRSGIRVVERVGVVQKHVGVYAEHAAGERAAALALVLVDVHPVLAVRLVEQLLIALAERQGRCLDELFRFLERNLEVYVFDHRAVEIEHVDLLEPQRFLAEFEVFAHGRKALVDRFDQAVVYGDRDVVAEQRRFACARVIPDVRAELVQLDVAAVECRKRIDILLVGAEHGVERLLADGSHGAFAEHAEVAGGQLYLVALGVVDLRQLHIDVREHLRRVLRRLRGVAQHRQHTLALRVEAVRTGTRDVFDRETVGLHFVRRKELVELLLGDRKDLRLKEREHRRKLHICVRCLAVHLLMLRLGTVGAAVQIRVDIRLFQPLCDPVDRVDARFEAFAGIAEGSLDRRDLRKVLFDRIELRFPSLVACVHVRKVPLEFRVHVFSCLHVRFSFV